jgi:hypothetical protein
MPCPAGDVPGAGWSLAEHRGLTWLNITAKAGGGKRREIHLPIPWHFGNPMKIGDAACKIYEDFRSGIAPDQAGKKITFLLRGRKTTARLSTAAETLPSKLTGTS